VSEIVETEKKPKKKDNSSTQPPLDGELAKKIERMFRNGESVTSIDCYPLFRGRDREQRLYHYDVKADENVGAERAIELANDIYSDCQLHCDSLPRTALSKGEGTKTYEVAFLHERRGGQAQPVGTHLLKLAPRIHRPAPTEDSDDDALNSEDGEGLSARKMMLEVHKETMGRHERGQQNMLTAAGDFMLVQKESIKDLFQMVGESHRSNMDMMREFREMIRAEGQRRVEEKAVAIDAENAAVEREMRRASMAKENMYTDVIRAGMLEGVKVLGALFPGFGQLFHAIVANKPIPSPPQLPNADGAATPGTAPTQPQLPPAPSEKALVDAFIDAAEKHKIDDTHTAAEKLFGKDDDSGKPLESGVFTREQVAILAGVRAGSLPIDALDAILPDSGKPEAIQGVQMAKAMAYLTPDMISNISRCFELRKAARKGAQ
jgi:hypothetical protein